jgi:hypothetical protein
MKIKASLLEKHGAKPEHNFVAYLRGTDLCLGLGKTKEACIADAMEEHSKSNDHRFPRIDASDLVVLAIDWDAD